MQAHLSARATNLKTHSSHYRLGVSKTLFDLHALRIHRHNLIGAVCVQFGRVRQQQRLMGAGPCFLDGFGRGAMTRTTVVLSPAQPAAIEHHIAQPCRFFTQVARVPTLRLALSVVHALPRTDPMPAVARDIHSAAHPSNPPPAHALDLRKPGPAKARVCDHGDPHARIDPSTQGLQQQALSLGIAQLLQLIHLLVDGQCTSHPQACNRRTQLHKLCPRTDFGPIHGNDQRQTRLAQSCQQRLPHNARLLINAPVSDETVHLFESRLQTSCAHHTTRQAREAYTMTAQRSGHHCRQNVASCSMDRRQVRLDEPGYDTACVHERPPPWLVPMRRKSRSCTRCFCATLLSIP